MGRIIYASLGSNLGDKLSNLSRAVGLIHSKVGSVSKISSIYMTPPWGFESDQDFFNICIQIDSKLSPNEVLQAFNHIEDELGRIRTSEPGYSSRLIDIDILTIDSETIDSTELTIPHPKMQERYFVLLPLQEIANNFVHPVSTKTIQQLIQECPDESPYQIHDFKISLKETANLDRLGK